MPLSVVKKEFRNKRVAFGKSAAPLSQREDLDDLAIIALESNDKSLLLLFEKIPSLALLKKTKTESMLKRDVLVASKDSKK